MTPEQKREIQRKNRRTGLILLSVAAAFFVGIMIRKMMVPGLFS